MKGGSKNLDRPLHRQSFVTSDRLATQIDSSRQCSAPNTSGEVSRVTPIARRSTKISKSSPTYYHAFGFSRRKWPLLGFRRRRELDVSDLRHRRRPALQGTQHLVHRPENTSRSKALSKDTKLHAGEYFNQGAMNKDLGKIRDLYGSYGFVFADIQADPRLLEESAQLDMVYQHQGRGPIPCRQDRKSGSPARIAAHQLCHDAGPPFAPPRRHPRHYACFVTTKSAVEIQRACTSQDPNKMPKIVFTPPPGMNDPDKQLAESQTETGLAGRTQLDRRFRKRQFVLATVWSGVWRGFIRVRIGFGIGSSGGSSYPRPSPGWRSCARPKRSMSLLC